ncbi:MAG: MarR family transcriptional regulator [Actinomycetota bacterium]|nr:MarR family transcriptional regulator [Actinomycetota bacterium]
MTEVRWLDAQELEAWRRLQLMQLQLTAALSRELAESSGLSYQDYLVLAALTDRPGGRMRAFELGRELGWEKSRLSHHVARMVERGLVSRERCETDQRGAFVVVTRQGRKAIEAAAPGHVEAVRRHFMDLLSPAELETLSAVAGRVLDSLADDPAAG